MIRFLIAAGLVVYGINRIRLMHKKKDPEKGDDDIACSECGNVFYDPLETRTVAGVACPNCGEIHIYKQLELRDDR